jgi:carbonic anhydrase
MNQSRITRRQAIQTMGAGAAVAGLLHLQDSKPLRADQPKHARLSADEALKRLLEGNDRFANGHDSHPHLGAARRADLVRDQEPFATIVGCSDSRVPPEIIFDQGLGDLFDVRVAGNVIDDDVLASIEYAAFHLHTSLVLVVGHESCGAVTATLEVFDGRSQEPEDIRKLLRLIEPSLRGLPRKLKGAARVSAAVEANVRQSMTRLAKSAVRNADVKIVGSVYDLGTGKVRRLDPK